MKREFTLEAADRRAARGRAVRDSLLGVLDGLAAR